MKINRLHNIRTHNHRLWVVLCSFPLIGLVLLLTLTIGQFGSNSLSGPSQIALIFATAIAIVINMLAGGIRWHIIEEAIEEKVRSTSVSVYILLIIGCMSSMWMLSGIVPTLICYGIEVIHPAVFLASACVISAVVSLMTGSSWTTIATIGIALLGIGRALGFDDGWTAGAIISGAYFGDKISPLSDTTVLASSQSGTPLFQHIRYMMFTTVPSICITLAIFLVAGMFMTSESHADTAHYVTALRTTFHISPYLMVVPVLTAWLIYRRWPSLTVLFLSTVMAIIAALISQPHILYNIGVESAEGHSLSTVSYYIRAVFVSLSSSTSVSTGMPLLDTLVHTSGMAGMMDTIWLILCAMCFGGAMTAGGMLQTVLKALFRRMMNTRLGLVTVTTINGLSMNLLTGDQYISVILTANMFTDEYKKQGYESRLLSRTCEDSATVTSVLVPWNTCGMTQATVLGVATLTYLPFCFFNILSPLMTIIHAAFGWKIKRNAVVASEE